MFSNAGENIKKYAIVLVIIQYVAIALAALFFIIEGINSDGLFMAYFIPTIIIGSIACVFVWISGSFMYAYGDMAECVAEIDETLKHPLSVYIKEDPHQASTAAQDSNIDPELIRMIYKLPAAELQRLLCDKRDLFKDNELALIEDALIHRAKEGQ